MKHLHSPGTTTFLNLRNVRACCKENLSLHMASAGARAYMGVWGLCPQWGPGGQGGEAPLKLMTFLSLKE